VNRSLHFAALLSVAIVAQAQEPTGYDSSTFGGLRARAIGPASMSGRIASVDASKSLPTTIFVGAAGGGVWRSRDGGVTFKSVFDEHPQSIGVVRVDPNNDKTIWVGTGESWVRNSVGVGQGVYKSTDGGDTWKLMGLEKTERIAEVLVDPKDTNIVYVCATGGLWSANVDRGVFKTTDGGASWNKILYFDADTGCSDLAINPETPNVLFAGMWTFRRAPDHFVSGGTAFGALKAGAGGLYKSVDGGKNWSKLSKDLPPGPTGRVIVTIAPSKPNIVYTIVESKASSAIKNSRDTTLYRSDDGGASWSARSSGANMSVRPFYFGELKVDPQNPERVYRPAFTTTVSEDGGKTFGGAGGFGGGPHSDHHSIWINPNDSNHILLTTDGGLYISNDRAAHWRFVPALPVSQFYHVSVDDQIPYNVYGGLQDNGSWSAPHTGPAGVANKDWKSVGFGDGFWVHVDPKDWNTIYSEYQGGELLRVNRKLGEVKRIKPTMQDGDDELRFNWNTPLHVGAKSGQLYMGAQYLFATADQGENWRKISPDLTTNNASLQQQDKSGGLTKDKSAAENQTTIYSISESPLDANTIWVGTDDGNVQLTRDGGKNWANLNKRLAGMIPAGTWVSRVEASPHDAATAFVAFDNHRRGDFKAYAFVTRDYGNTWKALSNDQIDGYVWIVKQDLVKPNLLFAGTEFGLFISIDDGQNWARFKENLPAVAVHDIAIHPQTNDVVLATHGRGVYVIDDITPLRALTAQTLDQEFALLPSRPATQNVGGALQSFAGDEEFVGEAAADAGVIAYYQKKRHLFGDLKIAVYDDAGKLITTLAGDKRKGMNRVLWPMRLKPPSFPPSTQITQGFVGPLVPEGTYKYVVTKGKETYTGNVTLIADPRSPHSAEDRKLQQLTVMAVYNELADLTFLSERISNLRDQARKASADTKPKTAAALQNFAEQLDAFNKTLAASGTDGGYVSGEIQLREKYGEYYGDISNYSGRPSPTQLAKHQQLAALLREKENAAQKLIDGALGNVNNLLKTEQKPVLAPLERAAWQSKQDGGGASSGGLSRAQYRWFKSSLRAGVL
jgi:photosystem II stability/assembly factor-like uncharacterized protein